MTTVQSPVRTGGDAFARVAPMRIFVCHASSLLTDHRGHGDGLLAHRTIVELAARGHEIDVATPAIDCADALPAGVRVHLIPPRRRNDGYERVSYALRMRQLFDRLQRARPFDLAAQLNPVASGLSIGLAGCGVPVVLGPFVGYWPGYAPRGLARVGLTVLSWIQQSMASGFVLSTSAATSRIVARTHAEGRTFVIPYGIDVDAFPSQPPKRDGHVVLFLGGTIHRKGIFTLLEAAKILRERFDDLEVVVAGHGWDHDRVLERIAEGRLGDVVRAIGFASRDDVPALMARANVFCLPSYGEPYGMTAVEAMASARAIVATSTGGLGTLVDPAGGRLVPPADAPALAAALGEILADSALAAAMGARNRHVAEINYAWPAVVDRLERVYSEIVEARCTPS